MGGLMYLLVLCLGIFVQIITHCHSSFAACLPPKKHAAAAALFIFGDSLFDNGNNNYINTTTFFQANYPPYGETFFRYPTGRFSNGRVIPDFVAEYAKLPLLPPYLHPGHPEYIHGVNFASGGAGALSETYKGSLGFKEASVACCGSGPYRGEDSCGGNKGIKEYELCDNVNEHLFFDSNHPTEKASQHFAELIWNGNRTVTMPYNLKQLFEV